MLYKIGWIKIIKQSNGRKIWGEKRYGQIKFGYVIYDNFVRIHSYGTSYNQEEF